MLKKRPTIRKAHRAPCVAQTHDFPLRLRMVDSVGECGALQDAHVSDGLGVSQADQPCVLRLLCGIVCPRGQRLRGHRGGVRYGRTICNENKVKT